MGASTTSPNSTFRKLANQSTSPTSMATSKMRMSRASSQVRYSKTILSAKKSYLSRGKQTPSKKKAEELYKSQARDINFGKNEFYIESKRVLTVEDRLVNCFKLSAELSMAQCKL